MGLDVALGVIILIAAIRGWLQGFLYQAIRIGGLIACVYLAAPVRDQVKPYILPYLPTIHPDLVDRLFWWVAACVTYVVLVGTSTLALKMTKRPEIPGIPAQRSRNDQFAGFLFGILKGALIAAFVAAAIQKYALKQIETIPWAEDQFKSSLALQWNRQYHPASKIWRSVPVRHLVNHFQRMGLEVPRNPRPPRQQRRRRSVRWCRPRGRAPARTPATIRAAMLRRPPRRRRPPRHGRRRLARSRACWTRSRRQSTRLPSRSEVDGAVNRGETSLPDFAPAERSLGNARPESTGGSPCR